ncbi:type II toxin-antitoxin system HicB family antitoxin [Lichenicoccus sp.]|uniref:type II toxin-antitoxin system HicB family antitoxin n=1 Tax=Lichenicoccus sp. TaxID=2781899 RepID=UPI003D0FA77D
MNVMKHKGYFARVEFDAADRIFLGRIAGINDIVGFHAETVADLEAAFHEAIEDYIETCARAGKTPEKPASGKVMFRMDPDVHQKAALAAQVRGVSLNQWAEEALRHQAESELA